LTDGEEGERSGNPTVADAVEVGGCCLLEVLAGFLALLVLSIVPVLLLR